MASSVGNAAAAATAAATAAPSFRCDSPPPDAHPVPALNGCPDLSRSLSTASTLSHGSGSDAPSRESLGSDIMSRHSSGSFQSRLSDVSQTTSSSRHSTYSTYSMDSSRLRRRGYVRPQGTDFAASARSRESVLSLGSIAHLQYYFARTGLLDGKGAQFAKKRQGQLSPTSSTATSPNIFAVDFGSPFGDIGVPQGLVESPTDDTDEFYSDEFDEMDAPVLPPTASTYMHRNKPVPHPPTIAELKRQLTTCLDDLSKTLVSARAQIGAGEAGGASPQKPHPGWYEVQGMQIIDVATLAIRAAKIYYTAHEQPERLTAIKSEKELRSELLSAMEVLKNMATRGFVGGVRHDEVAKIGAWIESVLDLLQKDEEAENTDRDERSGWLWARPNWSGTDVERALAFMASMDPTGTALPEWSPAKDAAHLPTPFLEYFQNGLRLVKLHNAAVRKSGRRFGTIPVFHTDTMKPYRCADNLRYWAKAAELRWEVSLKIDPLGIVYNQAPAAWLDFEAAILTWCRKVRTEIASELVD